jgi:UDP-N-acetylmuramoylalanine--D-glutamate ligase
MAREDFEGKNIHIIGMARSGFAAAEVLTDLGASLTMHDGKQGLDLRPELNRARELGAKVQVGPTAYEGIEEADIVVISPGVPDSCPAIVTALTHGIEIMPEIELAYRICRCPIIAVTGTNGKTTTTALLGMIIRKSGRGARIAGNIIAGDIRLPLAQAAFEASPREVIVAEISSFQLERITSFRPAVGLLLNINGDHMDRYPDLESYATAKARMFEFQEAGDYAVLNAEDPSVMQFARSIKSRALTFNGTSGPGTFAKGSEVWYRDESGERFVCDTAGMKLRGRHNLDNVLAAAAAAIVFGIDDQSISEAVLAFDPLEHRMEPVAEINGIEFLNNSMCTNVDASVKSLEAVGRPAILIAGGKDKGSDYGPLGQAFVKYAKHVVLIGVDAPKIESAALAAGFTALSHANSMESAVQSAWEQAEPGDTIMLSPGCASFDMFNDFEHRGRVFKAAVNALVERLGSKK